MSVSRILEPCFPVDLMVPFFVSYEQLTDFGLSEVGLIDSTSDLSGSKLPTLEHKSERRDRLGTPDYMAQEILLGTGHGTHFLLIFLCACVSIISVLF